MEEYSEDDPDSSEENKITQIDPVKCCLLNNFITLLH